jgi:hypothetical protein
MSCGAGRMSRFYSSFAVILLCLCAGCGGNGGSITTPTAPSGGGTPVTVVFGGGVTNITYSAQLNGQTYTAIGQYTVNLPAGVHVVSGTYRGLSFGVNFLRFAPGGGVESGSVRNLAGADATVRPCGVVYTNIDAPNVERAFRMQFTVTTNANSACQF